MLGIEIVMLSRKVALSKFAPDIQMRMRLRSGFRSFI